MKFIYRLYFIINQMEVVLNHLEEQYIIDIVYEDNAESITAKLEEITGKGYNLMLNDDLLKNVIEGIEDGDIITTKPNKNSYSLICKERKLDMDTIIHENVDDLFYVVNSRDVHINTKEINKLIMQNKFEHIKIIFNAIPDFLKFRKVDDLPKNISTELFTLLVNCKAEINTKNIQAVIKDNKHLAEIYTNHPNAYMNVYDYYLNDYLDLIEEIRAKRPGVLESYYFMIHNSNIEEALNLLLINVGDYNKFIGDIKYTVIKKSIHYNKNNLDLLDECFAFYKIYYYRKELRDALCDPNAYHEHLFKFLPPGYRLDREFEHLALIGNKGAICIIDKYSESILNLSKKHDSITYWGKTLYEYLHKSETDHVILTLNMLKNVILNNNAEVIEFINNTKDINDIGFVLTSLGWVNNELKKLFREKFLEKNIYKLSTTISPKKNEEKQRKDSHHVINNAFDNVDTALHKNRKRGKTNKRKVLKKKIDTSSRRPTKRINNVEQFSTEPDKKVMLGYPARYYRSDYDPDSDYESYTDPNPDPPSNNDWSDWDSDPWDSVFGPYHYY